MLLLMLVIILFYCWLLFLLVMMTIINFFQALKIKNFVVFSDKAISAASFCPASESLNVYLLTSARLFSTDYSNHTTMTDNRSVSCYSFNICGSSCHFIHVFKWIRFTRTFLSFPKYFLRILNGLLLKRKINSNYYYYYYY